MTRNIFYIFILSLLALVSFGCSKRSDKLMEQIPADATTVAIVNLDSISIKAGCEFDSAGAIVLSPALRLLEEYEDEATRSLISVILANADYINTIDLVSFVRSADKRPIVLFEVFDKEKLDRSLADRARSISEKEGYNIFTYPGCSIMTKGKFGWISSDADAVIDAVESLESGNVTGNKYVREFLDRPHDINMIVRNTKCEGSPFEYALFIGECKSGGIFAQCSFMDSEGEIFSFRPYINDVDMNLLSFIPPKTQLLIAFGEVVSWPEILEYIDSGSSGPMLQDYLAYFNLFSDFLTLIDGTTLLAVAPVDGTPVIGEISLDSWQALLLTRMSDMDPEKILSSGEKFFDSLDIKIVKTDTGTYKINFMGLDMIFGAVNGNLYVANYNILDGGNEEIMPEYEGKKFVFNISIPKGSETADLLDLPWGINFNISLHHNNIQMVLRLPGAEKPVLQEVIDRLTEF